MVLSPLPYRVRNQRTGILSSSVVRDYVVSCQNIIYGFLLFHSGFNYTGTCPRLVTVSKWYFNPASLPEKGCNFPQVLVVLSATRLNTSSSWNRSRQHQVIAIDCEAIFLSVRSLSASSRAFRVRWKQVGNHPPSAAFSFHILRRNSSYLLFQLWKHIKPLIVSSQKPQHFRVSCALHSVHLSTQNYVQNCKVETGRQFWKTIHHHLHVKWKIAKDPLITAAPTTVECGGILRAETVSVCIITVLVSFGKA